MLLGSCRYPGSMLDNERADVVFMRMLDRVPSDASQTRAEASLLLLAGDQIYADARAGMFDLQSELERYPSSYSKAWGSRHFSALLRRVPAAMILDDHEIANDFSIDEADRGTEERRVVKQKIKFGSAYYQMYQESLGPDPGKGGLRCMTHGGYPFVLFDSRRTRERNDPLSPFAVQRGRPNTIQNIGALLDWLVVQQAALHDVPKFVVTGSVMFPGFVEADANECVPPAGGGRAAARIDNWQGFAADRAALLEGIAAQGIANVVFLSGDYHCGVAAEMQITGGARTLHAASIAAPALYAPIPFVNTRPHELIAAGCINAAKGVAACYRQVLTFPEQGFCEIAVSAAMPGWRIEVSMLDGTRNGAAPAPARAVLTLP